MVNFDGQFEKLWLLGESSPLGVYFGSGVIELGGCQEPSTLNHLPCKNQIILPKHATNHSFKHLTSVRPQLADVTCFSIVLLAVSGAGVRKHRGRLCIPLSDKALITGVSPISSIPARHVTSCSPPHSEHSSPTAPWHGAALQPWLTGVKCFKHYRCQILQWAEMYVQGLATWNPPARPS